MKARFGFHIASFSLFLVSSTNAAAAETACLRSNVLWLEEQNSKLARDTGVFRITGKRTGKHRGTLREVTHRGSWSDMRRANGDLTPDLRTIQALLGDEAAEYFGVQQIDKNKTLLPDEIEMEGAISDFNSGLQDSDPRRILVAPERTEKADVPEEEYYSALLSKGTIPWASRGRYHYHDQIAHSWAGFILDNEFIRILTRNENLMKGFKDFCATKNLNSAEEKAVNQALEKTRRLTVVQFDRLGMLMMNLVQKRKAKALIHSNLAAARGEASDLMAILSPSDYSVVGSGASLSTADVRNFRLFTDAPSKLFYKLSFVTQNNNEVSFNENLYQHWTEYVSQTQKETPGILEGLPYDLADQLKKLEKFRAIKSRSEYEKKLRDLPLTHPFILRLERARALNSKDQILGGP